MLRSIGRTCSLLLQVQKQGLVAADQRAAQAPALLSLHAWSQLAQGCTAAKTSASSVASSCTSSVRQLCKARSIATTAPARDVMPPSGPAASAPGGSTPVAAAGSSSAAHASGTTPTLSQHPQQLAAVPSVARTLGFAGAIPFIVLSPPVAALLPLPPDLVASAALLQLGYGASIASFLGGIHWAMAMARYGGAALSDAHEAERYLWSVTPCLMAWPAVSLAPGPGSLVVGATLGIVYAVDRAFAGKGLLPPWYMALRLPLTLAAVGGMLCTLIGSLLQGEHTKYSKAVLVEDH